MALKKGEPYPSKTIFATDIYELTISKTLRRRADAAQLSISLKAP